EPGSIDEVVDGGHIDALGELLLVAQKPAQVGPDRAVDVHDRLAVRTVEHRAREPLDHGRRHLVVRRRRLLLLLFFYARVAVLVSVFTSVVVGHRRGPRDAVLPGGQAVGPGAVALLYLNAGAAMRGAGAPLHDLAAADLVVEHEDPLHERLGPGRATGHVHVDRHDLNDALHERVVVEHPTGAGAPSQRDDPPGPDHLVVALA